MHVVVLDIIYISGIAMMCETCKSCAIQVRGQWCVASYKTVDSHIELLASNQEGVDDVSLHDIWLSLWALWLPPKVILPLCDLLQLVEQEYALAL